MKNFTDLNRLMPAAAVVFLSVGSATAYSAVVKSAFDYEAGSSSYVVASGGSIDVSIYLHESVPSGGSSVLVADGGLYSGAFTISTPASGTSLIAIGSITGNAAFTGNKTSNVASDDRSATLDENVGTSPTGVAATATGSNYFELLGTVHLTAPAGSTSDMYTLGNYEDDTLTNTGESLDANGATYTAATGTSFVVSTPEPATATILLFGSGFFLRRRQPAKRR